MTKWQNARTFAPHILFTQDQLILLKNAIEALRHMMHINVKAVTITQFALATIEQVQTKVEHMLTQSRVGEMVGFDTNEILILQSAVKIFEAGLDALPPSPQGEELKKECQTLNFLFTAPISHRTLHD